MYSAESLKVWIRRVHSEVSLTICRFHGFRCIEKLVAVVQLLNLLEPPVKLLYVKQVTEVKLSYWQDSGSSGFSNTELKPNPYEPVYSTAALFRMPFKPLLLRDQGPLVITIVSVTAICYDYMYK